MQKPNYNYNYNYSGNTPSNIEKPQSSNIYNRGGISTSTPNRQYQKLTSNYIYQNQLPIQYYPIQLSQQQPAFNSKMSYTSISQNNTSSSFFVNSNNQFNQQHQNQNVYGKRTAGNTNQNNQNSQNNQNLQSHQNHQNNQSHQNHQNNQKKGMIKKQYIQQNIQFYAINSPKPMEKWHQNTTNHNSQEEKRKEPYKQYNSLNENRQTPNNLSTNTITYQFQMQKYIQWLHDGFRQFQRTGDVKTLKYINEQNAKQTKKLFQQINSLKQNNSNASNAVNAVNNMNRPKTPQNQEGSFKKIPNINKSLLQNQLKQLQQEKISLAQSITKEKQYSLQLERQIQQQIEIKEGKNLNGSRIRQQNHLNQMQQSITQLEDEIKILAIKNNQLCKKVGQGLPFFKEWNLMFEEAKGATKLASKLKQQIQKREDMIKELTNEDPSNNSDARSVKRVPSQTGDNIPNFKKQNRIESISQNKNKTQSNIARPASQIPNKFTERPQSSRANDVVIRHLSHSNRYSESKKTVSSSVDKTKQRKQSYDQKPQGESSQWKGIPFPQNLKNFGMKLIGNDIKK